MRIHIIKCNRCGAEIIGNPIKFFVNDICRDDDSIIEETAEAKKIDLTEQDFCVDCTMHILSNIYSSDNLDEEQEESVLPEESDLPDDSDIPWNTAENNDLEEAREAKTVPNKRVKIDYGKILALSDAGWSVAKIADEMGLTPKQVHNAKLTAKQKLQDKR